MSFTNWIKVALQNGAVLFYCNFWKRLLQIRTAQVLKTWLKYITNWERYYKLEELLQIRA